MRALTLGSVVPLAMFWIDFTYDENKSVGILFPPLKILPTSKLSLFELQPPAMRDNERCAGMMADNLRWRSCISQRFRLTIEPGISYMLIMLMVTTMMISITHDWNCSKKFGPGWNAVVGEAYSFEISYTKWEALNYLWIIQCQFGFFNNSI